MARSSMNETTKEKPKHVYRLPPCPAYDIEGMESWLSDMAEKGLSLSPDGFFAGFAIFEKCAPSSARYRLEAAPKKVSMWAEDGGAPDNEAVGLNEAYGWRYVASRGQFYIYRCEFTGARELNTDPEVQALALDMVRKRERGNLLFDFVLVLVYPIAVLRKNLLLLALNVGTGMFLATVVLLLWTFSRSVTHVVHLKRLRKKLSSGKAVDHGKNWKRKAGFHRISSLLLILMWAGFLLHGGSNNIMKVNEQLLPDYTDTLPFATMVDLAPAGQFSLDPLDFNNTIELGSDWLAPKIITLHENATIKLPNGQSLRVELYIDYYETAALWLAREVAREYLSMDKRSSHYQELQLPDLNVDYSFAYNAISPTLIVQEENKVMRVSLYQTSSDYNIPVDVWVRTFVDSIK